MCTSIALNDKDFYFGRNLDLEYNFGEKIVITPRNFQFNFRHRDSIKSHYAIIGMANVSDGQPLYAEAANEKGLCIAGLNFPGNAYYPDYPISEKENIAAFELIWRLLSSCENVSDAKELLKNTVIVSTPFRSDMPSAPLHWHIADNSGSIVLECTENGMKIYDNPVGVLTNNPPFEYHLTNLRNYINLTPKSPENRFSQSVNLTPYGQGMGALDLPGDSSPASRFVRAAFCSNNLPEFKSENEAVCHFFRILDNVAMVKGTVITPQGKQDCTTYSCCINASKGIYYYKTYENINICAVNLFNEDLDKSELYIFEPNRDFTPRSQN